MSKAAVVDNWNVGLWRPTDRRKKEDRFDCNVSQGDTRQSDNSQSLFHFRFYERKKWSSRVSEQESATRSAKEGGKKRDELRCNFPLILYPSLALGQKSLFPTLMMKINFALNWILVLKRPSWGHATWKERKGKERKGGQKRPPFASVLDVDDVN